MNLHVEMQAGDGALLPLDSLGSGTGLVVNTRSQYCSSRGSLHEVELVTIACIMRTAHTSTRAIVTQLLAPQTARSNNSASRHGHTGLGPTCIVVDVVVEPSRTAPRAHVDTLFLPGCSCRFGDESAQETRQAQSKGLASPRRHHFGARPDARHGSGSTVPGMAGKQARQRKHRSRRRTLLGGRRCGGLRLDLVRPQPCKRCLDVLRLLCGGSCAVVS